LKREKVAEIKKKEEKNRVGERHAALFVVIVDAGAVLLRGINLLSVLLLLPPASASPGSASSAVASTSSDCSAGEEFVGFIIQRSLALTMFSLLDT
jgi:hypothetical protein